MYTINTNITHEYEINKSKFITLLYKINDESEVKEKLVEVKKSYKDATHYCYGYIINKNYHFSDDGEPGGTAGAPIFNVINEKNLTNILCIVVRYFGGIKLGAGGLVRAYTKSVTSALEDVTLKELVDGYQIEFEIDYEETSKIDYLLKDIKVIYKEFNEKIKYIINIEKEQLELFNKYNYKIIKDIQIEKDLI